MNKIFALIVAITLTVLLFQGGSSLLPGSFGGVVEAGPFAYGICQTGCAAVAVACYSAAGYVFGTVTAGIGTPVAIIKCNAAFGFCSAKCAAITLFTPTP